MPVLTRTRGLLPLATVLALLPTALMAQTTIGPAGSPMGATFSDQCPGGIAGVTVRAGWWVDGVQLLCHAPGGMMQSHPARGGTGGDGRTLMLQPGETVTAISGAWNGPAGPYIYALEISTSTGRTVAFGHGGSDRGRNAYRLDVAPGQQLIGLTGRAGQYLHAIGLIVGPASTGGAAAMTPQPQPMPTTPSPGGKGLAPAPASQPQPIANPVPQPNYTAYTPGSAPAGPPDVRYEGRPIPPADGGSSRFAWCPQASGVCTDAVGGLRWRSASGGTIPDGALNLSRNPQFPYYACRAHVGREGGAGPVEQRLGYLAPRSSGCVIAASLRQVFAVREYEVLFALADGQIWVDMLNGALPRYVQAAVAGDQSLGVCITAEGGSTQVGWVTPATNGCVTEYRGVPAARWPFRLAMVPGGGQ